MQAYASIQNIYTHQAWPEGGPNICFFKVSWYTNHGKSAISGNPLVRMDGEENDHLSRFVHPRVVYKYDHTTSCYRYVLIGNCYQIPLAIWPHDPLGTSGSDLLEVIDRNQDQDA